MAFTDAEQVYLGSQPLGRLATIQPDGSPQVKPVGFHVNPGLGTIDVTGFNLTSSQKFRNVRRNGHAAAMLRTAMDDYRRRGAQGAVLFSDIDAAYYEKLGFPMPGRAFMLKYRLGLDRRSATARP